MTPFPTPETPKPSQEASPDPTSVASSSPSLSQEPTAGPSQSLAPTTTYVVAPLTVANTKSALERASIFLLVAPFLILGSLALLMRSRARGLSSSMLDGDAIVTTTPQASTWSSSLVTRLKMFATTTTRRPSADAAHTSYWPKQSTLKAWLLRGLNDRGSYWLSRGGAAHQQNQTAISDGAIPSDGIVAATARPRRKLTGGGGCWWFLHPHRQQQDVVPSFSEQVTTAASSDDRSNSASGNLGDEAGREEEIIFESISNSEGSDGSNCSDGSSNSGNGRNGSNGSNSRARRSHVANGFSTE